MRGTYLPSWSSPPRSLRSCLRSAQRLPPHPLISTNFRILSHLDTFTADRQNIHTHTHTHTYTYTHIHIHTYTHTYTDTDTHTHTKRERKSGDLRCRRLNDCSESFPNICHNN
ncbi:hypothetical protein LOAG_04141 [Loa loa]|uniref:Uncharacterized protein n=1 Tax=Loa loa TaxID=7209 RepID=A0A1S0U313_LOALO|nr:hypothetical protein LOAG_04141 [Loa loa]EFO24345.1 hypothetical protein LOAG_04141 [Loa loa]